MEQNLFNQLSEKKDLDRGNYRFYMALIFVIPVSFLGHFLFIGVFFLLKVYPLSIFNIFSTLLWLILFIFTIKRHLSIPFFLGGLELAAHAVFSTILLGWNCGFHFYIFCMLPYIFFIPSKKYILKFTGIFFIIMLYSGIKIYTEFFEPLFVIEILYQRILFYYIVTTAMTAIGLSSFLYAKAAIDAEVAFDKEYNRAESLLHNILPGPIVNRLKAMDNNKNIADNFDNVTVLFADIVGFTKLCSNISAEETVNILNNIFCKFDNIVDKYNLEKIKTIGDNYMLAGGLPVKNNVHADSTANAALEMLEIIKLYNSERNYDFNIRIGISSGPAVAGIIGSKKFVYDLWGDTVNTASRMESHGEPGKIQCTFDFYSMLKDRYNFIERGKINIKSKGEMKTYFLVNKK